MGSIGLVDGRIVDLSEKVLPMEDRGHQFGDGVYEVTRVYNSKCFALEPHLNRMFRSLRELRIPATYTMEELTEFHELLIKESGIDEGSIYLQITRGVSPRGHAFPEKVEPRLTMSIRPVNDSANKVLRENGAKAIVIPDERWLRCDIKSLNLLGNILGKQRAKEAGCFEAIMVRDGFVTEGTSSNFFIVKDGLLWTYPSSNLILKGITRTILIDKILPKLDLMVIEKPFSADFAKGADEAFVTGTNSEITPITVIDGKPIKEGTVGPITKQLQQAYSNLIAEECGKKN